MIRTFLDASVLIAAARGGDAQAARAFSVLDDPNREFVASPFLRIEVLPRAVFHQRRLEVAFYETYLENVSIWVSDLEAIVEMADLQARRYGVEAMDAFHVAAATLAEAHELVTCEKPTRSIHRATGVKVVTLHPVEP